MSMKIRSSTSYCLNTWLLLAIMFFVILWAFHIYITMDPSEIRFYHRGATLLPFTLPIILYLAYRHGSITLGSIIIENGILILNDRNPTASVRISDIAGVDKDPMNSDVLIRTRTGKRHRILSQKFPKDLDQLVTELRLLARLES